MPNITKAELETPRKASEIKSWVDNKHNELGSTKEGKHAVRFRKPLAKEFIEEALPLGIFCEHYFKNSDHVTIQHIISSNNYDAIIDDQRDNKTTLKYLEITQAHEGENAYLRLLKLEEQGHVSTLGKVTKHGLKHTGITVEVDDMPEEHSIIYNNELQRIYDAAKRKAEKDYPKNTGLIIMCDDWLAIRDSLDTKKLKIYMQKNILSLLSNFSRVFVVGWNSKTYLEFG